MRTDTRTARRGGPAIAQGLRSIVLSLTLALSGSGASASASAIASGAPSLGRGVNVLGYDPIWTERAQARFQAEDFARIKQGGFSHIRVNLQAFAHMDGARRLDPRWLETLDWVVRAAELFAPGSSSFSTSMTRVLVPRTSRHVARSCSPSGGKSQSVTGCHPRRCSSSR